ncbi:AtzE family amidohydrolase [Paracraurococcus ruber]|uniref:Asp-tRNA(Asn)/Glu-tRNA(Gln) amidotransferase GatCAB subunit A n=1 Tax=Paracraurococcus ruber TaxID=77675 RepID=A0ABS1D035_9PROT|nr:AtzE family amidohydrolase [Paracraurococcus ruber]MBK1660150.1 Asp-tRNA(Asn)/Glu-tRNA(Gln) amidotransferase GatCAB subunit A [Paracraurococcus ruber]TDG32461.1 AtzE family amidohydrolase [Paracraurococcus ruber]
MSGPALAIAARIRAGETTARAVTEAALARIAARNAAVNAFTAVLADRALAAADALDARIARGAAVGPLAGVPFAAKNLFDLAGIPTTAGSRIRKAAPPATRDAFLVRQLEAAGAICLGALNMDEFAYGFTTENSHDGPARNPHDGTRIAGGSSGGSAAAVAAGLVPLSLGTDTNGSIRVPASLCGLWGLKPSYGRLSRHGSFPFVYALDHVGPFARSVADLAAAYDALQGLDAADPAQAAQPPEAVTPGLGAGTAGLRVAVLGGWFGRQQSAAARQAVAAVAQALGATETVTWDMAEASRAAAFLITSAEGGALHLPTLRTQLEDYEPLIQDRLLAGALLPAAWINQAQRVRGLARQSMAALLRDWDVLLAPATPVPATPIGQEMLALGGVQVPLRPSMGLFTQPISGIGLPVVTAPVPKAEGALPIGVQLIGRPWAEATLFRAAAALEAAGICAAPVAAGFAEGAV